MKTKHRHKWEQDACDCPKCGYSGLYVMCACGEIRDIQYDKEGNTKLVKF